MIEKLIALGVGFSIETVFLMLGLWIMIKIQKLDYGFLGLLGSAALGSALDMIPYVGHFAAVGALYLCLRLVTRADLFPDVTFTVAVAYALVFCMNLFVFASLMGDLRAVARARFNPQAGAMAVADADEPDMDADADASDKPAAATAHATATPPVTEKPSVASTAVAAVKQTMDVARNPSKANAPAVVATKAPATSLHAPEVAAKAAAAAAPPAPVVEKPAPAVEKPGFFKRWLNVVLGWFGRGPKAAPAAPAITVKQVANQGTPEKTVDPIAAKMANEVSSTFSIKGVSRSQSDGLAIISTGVKNYTIAMGESISMETAKGKITVRCQSVDEKRVVLDVSGIDVSLLRR